MRQGLPSQMCDGHTLLSHGQDLGPKARTVRAPELVHSRLFHLGSASPTCFGPQTASWTALASVVNGL
jgi:hypothetical protein